MTELCEVCGLEPQVPGGCWRDFGGFDVSEDTVCYRLGFKRLKAENASLHGMATALGKQCAELERDRDYNAELRDAAEQRNTELEGALRQVVDAFTVSQEEGGPRIAIQRQEALQAAIRAVVRRGGARP